MFGDVGKRFTQEINLDVIKAWSKIPFEIVGRRAGDIATCYADTHKAETVLGWKAEKGIEDMCRDSWRWQQMQNKGK